MENFNIIKLIESNPIKKLTTTYNNKLLEKIKENFNLEEQQLFIASFYCYLNYNENDFVIDLDDVWKWLGFNQKYNAKRLLEKTFTIDKDYKILLLPNEEQKKDGRGGHNIDKIMLNIKTFKLFCLDSGTKKARDIHKYYVKLEKILQQTIEEESQQFKLEINNLKIKIIENKEIDRHTILLNKFNSSGSLVYIIKVKTFENGNYIVKIGESRIGVGNRFNEHKNKYDECIILDCFPVHQSKNFESFLHTHPDIKHNLVTDLENHKNEKELFLINNKLLYKNLIQIINNSIHNYNDNSLINSENEKLKLENENLKLINKMKISDNIYLKELLELNNKLFDKIHNLEKSNKEILEKINNLQTKNDSTTNFGEVNKNIGNRIQKINPDNGQLVKYYESISEIIKDDPTLKRSSITKSIKENIIYHGFRWMEISRELDPKIVLNYKPTKQTVSQSLGFIAKLNKEKTEIINVYIDRKTASICNEYPVSSSLDNVVKNKTESKGFYYSLYNECDTNLKNNFEKKIGSKVLLYKNGIGQYDQNNKLLNEYVSKYDCVRANGISDRTLKKALENNIAYNGYFYKFLEEKVKC